MTKRQALVAANWKMNGTLKTIQPLVREVVDGLKDDCQTEVAICPPCIYLQVLQTLLADSGIGLGAQNVSHLDSGAYTGEISVAMLTDYHCRYIIVGHSERREFYHETDDRVAEKFIRVSTAALTPILCIGERLAEREAGDTDSVIAGQLEAVVNMAGIDRFKDAVIAYEPVWAIGTGKTATPEQAQEVHAFIRLQLARHDDEVADKIRILYGGSVKPSNAADLFSMADIDGGLIGGASLVAADFLKICFAAG